MINEIHLKDCIELIKEMPDDFIHCVITSPPYNVDLGNNKLKKSKYSTYADNKGHNEYIKWLTDIFISLYPKLKLGARICINVGDGKNGRIPTASDLIQQLKTTYKVYTQIVWDKNQVGNRCAWGSYQSPSSPSYPTPFEHVIIFAKDEFKLSWKGECDLGKEEFRDFAYALWKITPETKQKTIGHPAMFPEEIPYRLIKMNTYIGDIVFDPFCGAGTTCLVADKLKRRFIGCDIDENYVEIAKDRVYRN